MLVATQSYMYLVCFLESFLVGGLFSQAHPPNRLPLVGFESKHQFRAEEHRVRLSERAWEKTLILITGMTTEIESMLLVQL